MKTFLIYSLLTALVVTGCRRHEEPETAPAPLPPPVKTPTPSPATPPGVKATAPKVHAPALTPEVTFTNLEQYVALDETQRLNAVSTAGNQDATPAAAAAAARKLAEMFRVESSTTVKTSILDELGFIESPAALEPVLSTFDTSQPDEVRQSAIDAAESLLSDLADSEDPNALNTIVRSLDARFPQEVREAGISALEDLEDQRALPYLQKLLTDSNPDIRQRADDAITWLKE